MKSKLKDAEQKTRLTALVSEPQFFRLKNPYDRRALERLLDSTPGIQVHDELLGQVEEYVKSINPKKVFAKNELSAAALNYLGSVPHEEFGVWIFYPWSNKLVHILDEKEFVEVRTNRNQYKITPSEKELLATKKIGVIGLSVGQSIALTIAMERICGELRIADFDILELSNLNRIRAGVHNLGVPKIIVAKREILEIDPYLKVTCFGDGLTEENVNDFYTANGKLDVCIEVCDGLYSKIIARQKAKEFRIPVVMNSSDRGTTDVERYDLVPDQPILHGLIDHLDLNKVKSAKTNEEKVPYLLPMLGVETSTDRLKASMIEIQETITTWPQLASGVVLGGAICTDVCRRVLLGELKNSERYFVDLEELIADDVKGYIATKRKKVDEFHLLPVSTMDDFKDSLKAYTERPNQINNSEELTQEEVQQLVKAGICAPSAGNVQPWKWLYHKKRLLLFHDVKRARSILNFHDNASYIALGAAAENIILEAHAMDLDVAMEVFPLGKTNPLTAVFTFFKHGQADANIALAKHEDDLLQKFIPQRITNRNLGPRVVLGADDLDYLRQVVTHIHGAELKIFAEPVLIENIKSIITDIDWVIMTNKLCHDQFMSEIRWSREEVEITRDGLDIEGFDITPTERAGLIVSRNWKVPEYIRKWNLGRKFGEMSRKAVDSASALALITLPVSNEHAYFDGGRALQKVWLAATSRGISIQPLSLSTFLSERVQYNEFTGLEDSEGKIRKAFNDLVNVCDPGENRKDIFLFRLCVAHDPIVKPLRRSLGDVLMYE